MDPLPSLWNRKSLGPEMSSDSGDLLACTAPTLWSMWSAFTFNKNLSLCYCFSVSSSILCSRHKELGCFIPEDPLSDSLRRAMELPELLLDLHVVSDQYLLTGSSQQELLCLYILLICLSIYQCRINRELLSVPRSKMDLSWFWTQEGPNPLKQGLNSLSDFLALPLLRGSSRCCCQLPVSLKNLWVHPQVSAPHGSTIWLLKISPWRGKGTLVRLKKLCSQINEQLKQNQIMMPIEIAPRPSKTFKCA